MGDISGELSKILEFACQALNCSMSRAYADLPLHYGRVPPWLYERMGRMGVAIIEAIVIDYGADAVLQRISDPFWFQALGAVLGMDWHSSGITTSVLGALKRSVNERAGDLGIFFCGGKGLQSRNTPDELLRLSERTGLNGNLLVRSSKLSAKVDNTAIQDGYQIYLHSFIVSRNGNWAVVQQGMNDSNGMARRYHWHSPAFASFVTEPHTSIIGHNQGNIINLTHKDATSTHSGILALAQEQPDKTMSEVRRLFLPSHHDVRAKDVDLKRLGSILAVAYEKQNLDFETLLMLEGVGPRTLQSLVMVSEVIHGTPSRFSDPARFSFAHGGKDGHPFPVPTHVYDEAIQTLETAISKAKIGHAEKNEAIRKLAEAARKTEDGFVPNNNFDQLIERERKDSWKYCGRTVFGKEKPPGDNPQLSLF